MPTNGEPGGDGGADEADSIPFLGQQVGIELADLDALDPEELLDMGELSLDEQEIVALQDRVRPGRELGLAVAHDADDLDVQGAAEPGLAEGKADQGGVAGHA